MNDVIRRNKLVAFLVAALALLVLPFLLQIAGNAWVRILDIALLYVLLALGLNIVVGYAGLLDLGYVAFFGFGAYGYALVSSGQIGANGIHWPTYLSIPLVMIAAAGLRRFRAGHTSSLDLNADAALTLS